MRHDEASEIGKPFEVLTPEAGITAIRDVRRSLGSSTRGDKDCSIAVATRRRADC